MPNAARLLTLPIEFLHFVKQFLNATSGRPPVFIATPRATVPISAVTPNYLRLEKEHFKMHEGGFRDPPNEFQSLFDDSVSSRGSELY